MRATRLQRVVSALERFPFDARTQIAGLLVLIGYCIYQAIVSPSDCAGWIWDWPAISAFALILIVVRMAAKVDDLLSCALRRLCALGVITCSEDEFERLNQALALRRRKCAPVWGCIIGVTMIVSFAFSWKWGIACRPAEFELVRIVLLAVLAPTCYAVGYYIGWMVVQGRLAHILKSQGIKYSVQPGHADEAAGLRPLGDVFFRQALLASAAPVYLAFWLAFFPYYLRSMSKTVFLLLLPIFIFVEVGAFVWPMWSFHREMVRQKRSLVTQADEIARRMSSAQAELRSPSNSTVVKELSAQLEMDGQLYADIKSLPTWPVNKQVRRWFTLQNIMLVAVPALSKLVGPQTVAALRKLLDLIF